MTTHTQLDRVIRTLANQKPRERWVFLGRETHLGYQYLIWELTANPRGRNYIGKRHAKPVQ